MALARRLLFLAAILVFATASTTAQVPSSVYHQVAADLDQHKYPEAEGVLKAALKEHPQDASALGLMGITLDAQKRYAEAEAFYLRAVRLSPRSSWLLDNLGNHYFAQGKLDLARGAYLRAVKVDPRDHNGNLQLAQIAIAQKQGRDALRYLGQLGGNEQATPAVQLLRAQALRLAGEAPAAEELLLKTLKESPGDPRVAYSVGMLFAEWERYEQAEAAFLEALHAVPTEFDVLYNLGLAAFRAHDLARAEQVFQAAVKQRPNDVDSMLGLARVEDARGDAPQAAAILYQARRLAPDRPDVLKFLAGVAQELGLYSESVAAYDALLKLQPGDDLARRDRGYALARERKFSEAVTELTSYVKRNPRDPVGLYDLALAESLRQRDLAVKHLSEALALDPKMSSARLARAALLRQQGKFDEAINDLELILKNEPDKVAALDLLGDTYLSAGKSKEAVGVLSKASRLAPEDSLVLLHYSQALMRTGQMTAAQAILDKFKSVRATAHGPVLAVARPEAPALGYPEPAHSATDLEKLVAANPQDLHLKVQLGELLLSGGKTAEALEAFQQVKGSQSNSSDLHECGRALLKAGDFKAALEYLNAASAADPKDVQIRMDLALAVFHDRGAQNALAELEKIPPDQRKGDYFLLRAQLLDSLGKTEAAAEALNRGFRASPTRADLYFQGALFLIKHGQVQQAVDLLGKADQIIPGDPTLLLARAMGFEILRQQEQALAVLTQLESLSPTWYLPYEIQGIILSMHFKPEEAKSALQMAIALGADNAKAYYYLAFAIMRANAADPSEAKTAEAQRAIEKAVALDPKDPYIQALAGKIAFLEKDYSAASQHLEAALTIWPDMVEAHETLSGVYRALGEKEKSADELKEVLRIKQQSRTAEQIPPFPTMSLLFAVQSP